MTQNFAARFTGTLSVTAAGSYTFALGAASGTRLLLNGSLLAEVTNQGHYALALGTVTLTAGSVPIEVDYFNGSQVPELQLSYSLPGPTSGMQQVVPQSMLMPAAGVFTATSGSNGTFSIPNVPVTAHLPLRRRDRASTVTGRGGERSMITPSQVLNPARLCRARPTSGLAPRWRCSQWAVPAPSGGRSPPARMCPDWS